MHLIWLTIAACLFCHLPAEAALVDKGNGLIVDTSLNIEWTQDANLFKTKASASADPSAFVADVIAAANGKIASNPNVFDTPRSSGVHNLTANDFNLSTGAVDWFGAMAWVGYLNSISYGGFTDWRLPATFDNGLPPQCTNNFSACGDYNVDVNSSELAHLFYVDLQNRSAYNSDGSLKPGVSGIDWGLVNSGPFVNAKDNGYWSGTENAGNPNQPWFFATFFGSQGANHAKISQYYAWAVRSDAVTSVPIPGAFMLFASGLGLIISAKRISLPRLRLYPLRLFL